MKAFRIIISIGLILCLFQRGFGQTEAEAPSVTLQHLNGHSKIRIVEGRSRIIYKTEDGVRRKGHVSYVGNTEMVVGADTVQFSELRMLQGSLGGSRGIDFRSFRGILFSSIASTIVTGAMYLTWRSALAGWWFEGGLFLLGFTTFGLLLLWAVLMVALPFFIWLALRKYHVHTKWNFISPKTQPDMQKG